MVSFGGLFQRTFGAMSLDLKDRHKRVWGSADYNRVATTHIIVSEELCESAELRANAKVLDVASGTGNTALAAARRFCKVTAVDFVPDFLSQAEKRAEAEGLELTVLEADVENLPFESDCFDAVVSSFGVMFSNDPQAASRELFRVCKSGGVIALANWAPDGLVGDTFDLLASFRAPPPGARSPVAWGQELYLRELFGQSEFVSVKRKRFMCRYLSALHWIDYFKTYYGPFKLAFETLEASAQDALSLSLVALISRYNVSGDTTILAPVAYLEVVMRKP